MLFRAGFPLGILLFLTMLSAFAQTPKPTPKKATTAATKSPTPTPTPSPSPTPIPGEHLDKPAWVYWFPPVAQGLTALAGGCLLLWQFNRAHKQRDEHLDKTQAKLAELANLKDTTDKAIAREREQREAIQFAKKELQDQFVDIENRLALTEPMMRANAALRLAEFATRLIPRTADDETKDPTPPRIAKNNPYFIPVASQLATALHLEANAAVRQDIVKAFASMIEWAKKEPGQELLHDLINLLADANRTAKDTFIRAFAEYSVVATITDENEPVALDLNLVSSVARLCRFPERTKICLQALMIDEEEKNDYNQVVLDSKYETYKKVYAAKRKAIKEEEQSREDALRLSTLEMSARQLKNTQDALARALSALTRPEGCPELFPTHPQKISNLFHTNTGARAHIRSFPLNLSGCFLAGAYFHEAQLQEANFLRAHLQGVFFFKSYLQGAELYQAKMQDAVTSMSQFQFANLVGAQLQSAHLPDTKFQSARLSEAELENSDLSDAEFQDANLSSVNMIGANLFQAQLQGANLSGAQLYKANLSRTQLDKANFYGSLLKQSDTDNGQNANFNGSNYSQALFIPSFEILQLIDKDLEAMQLLQWLEQFPKMPEDEIITYEVWKAMAETKDNNNLT